MLKEFKEFISNGNVMDLAIGVIIGGAFGAIVTSLVNDLIMPLVSVFTGGTDFTNKFYAVGGGDYATLDAARESGVAVFAYGSFIMAIINFLIIAFVIFMLVRSLNKMKKAQAEAAPEGPSEVDLLTEIRDALAKKK